MIKDHLIEEGHSKERCSYCSNSFLNAKWLSIFEGEHHYKSTKCPSCGKENRVKVGFGSGHDSWDRTSQWVKEPKQQEETKDKTTIKQLEPTIKQLERVDKYSK